MALPPGTFHQIWHFLLGRGPTCPVWVSRLPLPLPSSNPPSTPSPKSPRGDLVGILHTVMVGTHQRLIASWSKKTCGMMANPTGRHSCISLWDSRSGPRRNNMTCFASSWRARPMNTTLFYWKSVPVYVFVTSWRSLTSDSVLQRLTWPTSLTSIQHPRTVTSPRGSRQIVYFSWPPVHSLSCQIFTPMLYPACAMVRRMWTPDCTPWTETRRLWRRHWTDAVLPALAAEKALSAWGQFFLQNP